MGLIQAATSLTAIVAGVVVAAGLELAATTGLKFFRPATAGIFGAIALPTGESAN